MLTDWALIWPYAAVLSSLVMLAALAVVWRRLQMNQQAYAEAEQNRQQLEEMLQELAVDEARLLEQLRQSQLQEQRLQNQLTDSQQQLATNRQQQQAELAGLHDAERKLAAAQAGLEAAQNQLAQQGQQLELAQQRQTELQHSLAALQAEQAAQQASLEQKELHFAEQLAQLREGRQLLVNEFEQLASKVLEEKGRNFAEQSQHNINGLLGPIREQLTAFQQRINQVHDASQQGQARLVAEIGKVVETGLRMQSDADNLARALKGDSKQRGDWGEMQLVRSLEASGLEQGVHFSVQDSFRDAEGKQRQTDVLILLPGNKHLVLDSKVTLNAYERFVNSASDAERASALTEHLRAVRRHIDELSAKNYSALAELNSPGMVLMFMPLEPAFIEVLRQDVGLFDYGIKKNVVLVSHTTLIPVLRTVANLWTLERSHRDVQELAERAGDIFTQVSTLGERLTKLGNSLGAVSNHYNSVVTALVGQQGLYGKVERFGQLSMRNNQQLPRLEPRQDDLHIERLQKGSTDSD